MDIGVVQDTYQRLTAALTRTANDVARDYDHQRYDVDELIIREPLAEAQNTLDTLVQQWKELDQTHAVVRKRKLHQAGASHINIPDGFDPLNPPQPDQSYEGKLADIMRRVPRIRQMQQQLHDANTKMMQLKRSIDAASDPSGKLKHLTRELNYVGLTDKVSERSATASTPPADTVVLNVAVSSPKSPNERTQEIEFLSSHSLSEIGRHIICLRHHFRVSHAQSEEWLFVEGQFYASGERATADADTVRLWCAENTESLRLSLGLNSDQPTTVHRMETTTFQQLSMRLGVRYVYVHSGNCQHFLYLVEARSAHSELDTRLFPSVVFQNKIRKRKCEICLLWTARFTVVGDKLADRTPNFQCKHCYQMLHYSAQGERLYKDFEVYPYIHDVV